MLTFQGNTTEMNGLFSTYNVFNKILLDHLGAYHWISPQSEMEQVLILLTLDIPSYDLLGLNIRILDKPLSRRTLDENTGSIYE